MQRYFIPADHFDGDHVRITGDDAHHLIRVMRAEPGDEIICCDGRGRSALVKLTRLEKAEAAGTIIEDLPSREPGLDVWIAQSLPKGDKLETVIQKATEIGAARFVPFLSERTIVQYDAKKEAKRLDRWRKIAKEAAEQAHRSVVPEVDAPISWRELIRLVPETDLALFCYENESGRQLKTVLQAFAKNEAAEADVHDDGTALGSVTGPAGELAGRRARILVIVGPEGGFSEKEAAEAEAAGCRSVGLGARILRTETAAMVALACILYEYGEMGR